MAERARDLIRQVCQSRDIVIIRGAVSPDQRPYAAVGATDSVTGETGAIHQRSVQQAVAGGVSGVAKRVMGTAYVGARVFCATVGAVDEATIKAYIENQKWAEDEEGFRITAPTKP